MLVKLIALRGSLKSTDGQDRREIPIRRRRFLIGSASDCQLCCPSRRISDQHCLVLVRDSEVLVRDLDSAEGTFINGQRVSGDYKLTPGDVLRVGRLEFEVMFETGSMLAPDETAHRSEPSADPLDGDVSDWLEQQDEAERESRRQRLDSLRFQVPDTPSPKPEEEEPVAENEDADANEKTKPKKKKRGKLPKQVEPKLETEDSISAAEEGLRKLFGS